MSGPQARADGAAHTAADNAADDASASAWSGRFAQAMDDRLKRFNASIGFDHRLALHDIRASQAHARMLCAKGILSDEDVQRIVDGLDQIGDEIRQDRFAWSMELEDVHFNIERRLTQRIGDAGKRLHTARSRNDQVATTMRLYLRDVIDAVCLDIRAVQQALVDQADRHAGSVMPGFTHLQAAQPVTWGHHLLAYFEMLERDHDRLRDARRRLNQCPLGSAALAGTGFDLDRGAVARALGFDGVTRNSMDSVSDRDFVVEFLAAASLLMVHLSRLAEEIIFWSSSVLGWVALPDRFCTGSSIMPQKKNPDIPELARAKAGRVIGLLTAGLAIMKAQPLAYNKDNQEVQCLLFDAESALRGTLEVFAGLIAGLQPDVHRMLQAARAGHATATDLADHLVRQGVAFRDAHEVVARAVRLADESGVELVALGADRLASVLAESTGMASDRARAVLGQDLAALLSVQASAAARAHVGGTAPDAVRREVARARDVLSRGRERC